MADATKNINFHTRVTGTEEAKRKIAGITGELDKTATTVKSKVNPAMDDMAGGMDEASESTEKLGGKLGSTIGYLIGGAGIAAAVYIAKKAWDDINISFSEGSERLQTLTKDLEGNLSETYKVKEAWDAFTKSIGKWGEEKLEDAVETLNTRIKSLTLSMIELAFYATIDPSGLFASQLTLEELKKELELVNKELLKYGAGTKSSSKATFEATFAAGAFKEKIKGVTKEIEKQITAFSGLIDKAIQYQEIAGGGRGTKSLGGEAGNLGAPEQEITKAMGDVKAEVETLSFASVISEMETMSNLSNNIAGSFETLSNNSATAVERISALLSVISGIAGIIGAIEAIAEAAQIVAVTTAVVTGTAIASAYAPAAAMVSLATLGTNSIPAMTGIGSTVAFAQGLAIPMMEQGGSFTTPGSGGGFPMLLHKNETVDVYNSGQTSRMERKLDNMTNIPNIIILKIGEEEVSRFVSKGNEYNRMRRLN